MKVELSRDAVPARVVNDFSGSDSPVLGIGILPL
jgi:hypothetical protein